MDKKYKKKITLNDVTNLESFQYESQVSIGPKSEIKSIILDAKNIHKIIVFSETSNEVVVISFSMFPKP